MRIGGHRGWKSAHPDNTMEAFRAAAEHVDFVEIDVRWALDGVAILSHDPVVNGVTLAEHGSAQLRSMPETAHVPTFAELLAELPDLPLDIELKHFPGDPDFDPSFGRPAAAASLARPGDVVTCFHWPTLAEVKERLPRVLTGVLLEPPTSLDEAVEEAVVRGHRFVVPERSQLEDRSRIADIHGQGLLVGTWTVNDPSEAKDLSDYGVDAVVTDDPVAVIAEVRP